MPTGNEIWPGERRIVITFILAALILYAPGLWWGLPHATAPNRIYPLGGDELTPIAPVAELYNVFIARTPPFNPQYPLFYYIMTALIVTPYLIVVWLSGGLPNPSVHFPYGLTDPVTTLSIMTLLSRSLSLLAAAGVVVIGYKTATILWNRTTGIIAGVLVLLTYPMFYYSHTSNVDMTALFWTTLGLAVSALCLRDSLTSRRSMWLGIFAALAVASKDTSYAAFLMVALVHVPLHLYRQRKAGISGSQARRPLWIGFWTGLGLYVVASGLVIHPGRYYSHIQYITLDNLSVPDRNPATLQGYLTLSWETWAFLMDSLSPLGAVVSIVGLILCLFHTPWKAAWSLPALGIFLFVLVPVRFVQLRHVFIMAYILSLFAAFALAESLRFRERILRLGARVLLASLYGWCLLHAVDLTYQKINEPRNQVASWFRRYARPGDCVLHYVPSSNLPPLEATIHTVDVTQMIPLVDQVLIGEHDACKRGEKPEFILLIAVEHHYWDLVHERGLAKGVYQKLRDGSLGYEQVIGLQARSLFLRRPLPFVNPPVKLFVRRDRLLQMADVVRKIELNH